MRRLPSPLTVGLVVVPLLAGCAVDGLAFRTDDRVVITEPGDRAEVELPVTVRWSAPDLAADPEGGPFFAVFVDRAPIRPGQSLRSLADDACNHTEGCPDVEYFRDRFIFLTSSTSVSLDAVPQSGGLRTRAEDRHEATVILVDAEGRRIGEAAYTVEFTVEED